MRPNPLAFLFVAATTLWGAAFGEVLIGAAVGVTAVTVGTAVSLSSKQGPPSPNDLEGKE